MTSTMLITFCWTERIYKKVVNLIVSEILGDGVLHAHLTIRQKMLVERH